MEDIRREIRRRFLEMRYADQVEEIVRLMEWVRSQCAEQVGGAAEDTHERICDLELTLPPDDWKP